MAVGDWTAAYQATPNGATDPVSLGDNEFNTLKGYVYDRAKLEHNWSVQEATYSDDGRHVPGSARAFYQAGPAGPTGLRRPDNSAYQTTIHAGGGLPLTGAKDQGRLWVDSVNGPGAGSGRYQLRVLDSAGNWQRVSASSTWATTTPYSESVDAGAIASGGATTTLVWPGALQVVTPAQGTFRLVMFAKILLKCGGNARNVRCDLMQDNGGGAVIVASEELSLNANDYASMHFAYTFPLVSGTTYDYSFIAEASGAGVTWGYHANTLVGNGADNCYHTCVMTAPGV